METLDYPIFHFRELLRLSEALKELPAQIMEHEYDYESFGFWSTIVRYKGIRFRIIYDGKEGCYEIQRSTSRKSPDIWINTPWRFCGTSTEELPVSKIVETILNQKLR